LYDVRVMSLFERDTIMRQIRQLGDAIAGIVSRARAEGQYETGLEAVREAAQGGLGVAYPVLNRLAPESAALLLRDAELIRTYGWICAEEADLLGRAGQAGQAAARRGRAIGLYAAAASRDRSLEPECRAAATALARLVDATTLDERCRLWLESPPTEG